MENIYRAKQSTIEKLEKKKTSEILQIIGFGLLSVLAALYLRREQLYELAHDMDASVDTVKGWLIFILAACGFFVVCSFVILIAVNSKLEVMNKSYVKLTKDGIIGVSSSGSEFYIAYSDIKQVLYKADEEENLTIFGRFVSYRCLEIQDGAYLAQVVNKVINGEGLDLSDMHPGRIAALDSHKTTPFEGAISGEREAYFLNCDSRNVICPFCQTIQSTKNDKCVQCGVDFVFEYE